MSLALAESRSPDLADARDLLRRVWGHAEFRGLQAGIIGAGAHEGTSSLRGMAQVTPVPAIPQ